MRVLSACPRGSFNFWPPNVRACGHLQLPLAAYCSFCYLCRHLSPSLPRPLFQWVGEAVPSFLRPCCSLTPSSKMTISPSLGFSQPLGFYRFWDSVETGSNLYTSSGKVPFCTLAGGIVTPDMAYVFDLRCSLSPREEPPRTPSCMALSLLSSVRGLAERRGQLLEHQPQCICKNALICFKNKFAGNNPLWWAEHSFLPPSPLDSSMVHYLSHQRWLCRVSCLVPSLSTWRMEGLRTECGMLGKVWRWAPSKSWPTFRKLRPEWVKSLLRTLSLFRGFPCLQCTPG